MNTKNRNAACLPLEGTHIEQPKTSLAWAFWRFLWMVSAAYKADKAYYRGLIVRAVEDAVVWIVMSAAIWTICHLAGGIFKGQAVG